LRSTAYSDVRNRDSDGHFEDFLKKFRPNYVQRIAHDGDDDNGNPNEVSSTSCHEYCSTRFL